MLICIHMLTKRTNILFDEQLWNTLSRIAQERKTSVGELVRTALVEKYAGEEKSRQIKKAVENIEKFNNTYGKQLAKGDDSAVLIRKMRDNRYGNLNK